RAAGGTHVGRRAADADHRPHPDGQSALRSARRAVGRVGADHRRADGELDPRPQRRGVERARLRAEPAFFPGRGRSRLHHRKRRNPVRWLDGRPAGRRFPSRTVPFGLIMCPASLTVGIDVGGTFTDLLAVDPVTNTVKLAKVPTTIDNQAVGFMAALMAAGADPAALQAVVHGTTTTTNALLERKISRVGLITTKGFRDGLELGPRPRPPPYGFAGTLP